MGGGVRGEMRGRNGGPDHVDGLGIGLDGGAVGSFVGG